MASQLYAYSGINLRWAPHVWLRVRAARPIRGQEETSATNQKPSYGEHVGSADSLAEPDHLVNRIITLHLKF